MSSFSSNKSWHYFWSQYPPTNRLIANFFFREEISCITIIVWEQEIRSSSTTRDEAFVGPIDTCPSTRVSNSKDIHSGVCHFIILQGNSICVPPRPQSHHSSSDNQMQRKMTVQGFIAKLCPSEKQLSIRQRTDRQTDHEYQIIYSAESI